MNIVALGSVACRIAEQFKKHPQYKIFLIDDEEGKRSRYFLKLPKYQSGYDYEQNVSEQKIEKFLKNIKEETLLVTCGSERISLLSLMVLQQISKLSRPSVLYIKPDVMFLNQERKENERIVREGLQSYAIHDFLEQIYLIDNLKVEKVIEEYNMENYFDKINEAISWSIHILNYCDKQTPIADNFISNERYGINTIGINEFGEKNEENMLYSLDNVKEKRYYYIINKELIKSDKGLLGKIRKDIEEKTMNKKEKIYYGIFPSELEKSLVVSLSITMGIQK
ncbi:MAG: hypothetical protein Q8P81_02065 [Nanoarchaeota archaeon]|nr:hypothetical protein [Nanoarchaeota archaeon]